ncbi:hypothetical protein JCM16303_000680 [Sporobolomyces ruberrimus]
MADPPLSGGPASYLSFSSSSTPNGHSHQPADSTVQHHEHDDGQDSPQQVKPIRPMLARGAACDTCRARKVKCDALRPHCSPCLKSARGNLVVAGEKCAYEGTSVAIATANRAAEIQKNGGVKRKKRQPKGTLGIKEDEGNEGGPARKRKKKVMSDEEDQDQEDDSREGSRSVMDDEEGDMVPRDMSGERGQGQGQPPARYPVTQLPSVFMDPQHYRPEPAAPPRPPAGYDQSHQHYARPREPSAPNASWQTTRPLEPPYPHAASRFTLPPQPNSDRYPTHKPIEPPGETEGEKEQLAGRVAELERQLRFQGDPQAEAPPRATVPSAPGPPLPNSNAYGSSYASPAPGARSPSFPYGNYSSYAPPTPGYGSYGSTYLNSPSSSSFPPAPSNPLAYSNSSNSQYPPIQLPPPNSSTPQYGSNPPLPLPVSNLQGFDPSRRRSLSTLSAIAGAVGMEEYPPLAGSGANSPMSTWSSHHLHGQDSYSGGYRFSTSSPVSSTRHLGTEPQAFALTTNTSSPGRSHWNTTTSSLRTEMTSFDQPPSSNADDSAPASRIPSPPTAASSSNHSASNSTSPSTALPTSVKTSPSDPNNSTYFEPFDLGPSGFPLIDLSYPPSLPPLSVLHHLVSTFFKRAAVPATMLSKAKLFFTLSLSPTDPRWPDEALLHSICAYGCMFVSEESLGGGEYGGLGFDSTVEGSTGLRLRYWELEGDQSAKDYHYRKAKMAIEEALSLTRAVNPTRNLFQVLQAVVLVCYVAYSSAQFSDLWLLAGTATRLIAPLGLNHLEPWDFDRNRSGPPYQDWGIRVRKTERTELLGPVKNLSEHWERSCTFWLAFAVDRFASANTDWTTSIDEKDISTHLPCIATRPMPGLSIDPRLCHIPSLYLASPDFLQDTSAPIGSLGLYIKATIILGRVVNFTQRFPRYLAIPMGETCSSIKRDIKAGADFIELDVAISKFKASHSANFFDNAGSTIDGFLASAYVIPHVATILLHETLTDRYDRTPSSSIQRCLVAAKCIINSTYVLYQSSYDLGGVDPFLPFCWSVAGRALVRDYTTRKSWGETEEAESAKQLAEHCLSFTQHCAKSGSKIAQRLTETLKGHLENPESLLPLDAGCGVVFELDETEQIPREVESMGRA